MRTLSCCGGLFFLTAIAAISTPCQQVVFPMGIGDRWNYGWRGESAITRDSTFGNGQTYSIFSPPMFHLHFSAYHRQSGDQVFVFDSETGNDELVYDFSLSVGDTVNSIIYGPGDTTTITFSRIRVRSIFGVQRREWIFLFDRYPQIADDGWVVTIVDSIGLYSHVSVWSTYGLVGAVINGIEYGEITSVDPVSVGLPWPNLHQNYPNPFNATTIFEFSIPTTLFAHLSVYNLLGERVATLVEEQLAAGTHSVEWDASGQPSGVYFYRLSADGFVHTKRLVLLR